MKEIREIIQAYEHATAAGIQTALATVVLVEGSAYRRPGARMLVTAEGNLTGAISGGCLEGDALRKALFVMMRQQAMIVKYDTTDEDDAKFGVQLGCNGIIHILIEPIDPGNEQNPVVLLKAAVAKRQYAVVATVFSLQHHTAQPGTCLALMDNQLLTTPAANEDIIADATTAFQLRQSITKQYNNTQAFLALIIPEVSLLIFGAGNDAMPIVDIANILGWQVTVIDGRRIYATPQRFPACNIAVAKPEEALRNITIDERTAAVLLTHNYNYDLAMLRQLVPLGLPYIGILGARKKIIRMMEEPGLNDDPVLWENVHGPVGLDLGAETAEEIALSIIAEIKACLGNKTAKPLREKKTTIHAI